MADVTVALTGTASATALGAFDTTGLTTLSVSGFASLGAAGGIGAPVSASAALTLRLGALQIGSSTGVMADMALALPVPQLSVSVQGRTGLLADVLLVQPAPQLTAGGVTGTVCEVALALPIPTLSAQGPNSTALTLPAPVLTVAGVLGAVGDVRLTLPLPTPAISALVLASADAMLTLPALRLVAVGTTGAAARVALTLRALSLAAEGHSGVVGQVVLTLPVGRFTASGYQPALGVAQLVLPALLLQATGRTAAVAAGTAKTLVLQTEAMKLSTYSHYPFNSFAAFGGLYLGASDDGVFALAGADDAGVPIQAVARLGVTDFGTSHLKRVDKIYVGYRADGDLIMRVTTDGLHTRDYRVRAQPGGGIRGNHATLGKGVQARYWQLELRNQNGAAFALDTIEVLPTPLRRRVGGNDA